MQHLAAALAQYEVVGLRTNLALLRAIADDAEFAAGGVDKPASSGATPDMLAPEAAVAGDVAVWAAAIFTQMQAWRADEGDDPCHAAMPGA